MPMTTMITLIVLRTITVALPQPPMMTIDLMCMVMKVKMLMMIQRKVKQEVNPELRHPSKNKMMEFHKVLLPKKTMRTQTPIPILMHTMPMTTMYTLILLKTITVTFPWPPMVKIDLNCIIMKAKQVINSLKRMKTMTVTCLLMTIRMLMVITMLRMITMMVTMPLPPNLTQRTSTRHWVIEQIPSN